MDVADDLLAELCKWWMCSILHVVVCEMIK